MSLPTPPTTPVKTRPSTALTRAFVVRDSATGGVGAFAARALVRNEVILEEMPLFVAERADIFKKFGRLSRKKQRKTMMLHASGHLKPGTPYLEAVWDTNSFATGSNREAGLFPIAARFNHACEPNNNIHFEYDAGKKRLRFWVGVDGIAEGEELKICYGNTKTPALLYKWYGFRCGCGACGGLSDQEVDKFAVKW